MSVQEINRIKFGYDYLAVLLRLTLDFFVNWQCLCYSLLHVVIPMMINVHVSTLQSRQHSEVSVTSTHSLSGKTFKALCKTYKIEKHFVRHISCCSTLVLMTWLWTNVRQLINLHMSYNLEIVHRFYKASKNYLTLTSALSLKEVLWALVSNLVSQLPWHSFLNLSCLSLKSRAVFSSYWVIKLSRATSTLIQCIFVSYQII